jgi:hypothetical protein
VFKSISQSFVIWVWGVGYGVWWLMQMKKAVIADIGGEERRGGEADALVYA